MSEKEDRARSLGDVQRGARSLQRRKAVVGWWRAAERNLFSVRRKATRLSGLPAK